MKRKSKLSLTVLLVLVLIMLEASIAFAGSRLGTEHPNPSPLSNVNSSHPRLWFDSASKALVQDRWDNDSFYDAIKNDVLGTLGHNNPSTRAVANAFAYVATGNTAYADAAIDTVEDYMFPNSQHTNNEHKYERYDNRYAAFTDAPALVFDWVYDSMSSSEKSNWIARLNERLLYWEDLANANMRWHEGHVFYTPYISIALAIYGESGAANHLSKAHNMVLNWNDMENEASSDGAWRPYNYQVRYQPFGRLMWSLATDRDVAAEAGFVENVATAMAYRLGRDKDRFMTGPGEHQFDANGYVILNETPGAAMTLYGLASHFDDSIAQWLGDRLRIDGDQATKFGAVSSDPNWLAYILHDPSVTPTSPSQAHLPLAKLFEANNQVTMRSGWEFDQGQDIVAWLYSGSYDSHALEGSTSHWDIRRGDDRLAMPGHTYLGAPSDYKSMYSRMNIAFNSVLFEDSDDPASVRDRNAGFEGEIHESSGEYRKVWSDTLDDLHYPDSMDIMNYRAIHYSGEISYFDEGDNYAIATADPSFMYGSRVDYFKRDLIHLRPGIFIMNDRFDEASNVDNIRWLLHSPTKPIWSGIPSDSEGILETAGPDEFTIENGGSKLDVSVLWPNNPTKLKAVGGIGYESHIDGNQYGTADAQKSRNQAWRDARWDAIEGKWRTEVHTDPSDNSGNIVVAMHADDINGSASPSYSIQNVTGGKELTVTFDGTTYEVFLPNSETGTPTVTVDGSGGNPDPDPQPGAGAISFETGEGYSTGSLYGQNGWTQTVSVGGDATVQTTDVYSGSQAVSVTTPASASEYNYEEASLDVASTTDTTLSLRVNQPSTADTLTFFKAADTSGNVLAHVRLSSGNVQARYGGTWNTLSGASYTANTWHEWDVALDHTTQTYDLYRDNVSVASDIPFYASGSDVGEILIGSTTKVTGVASESLFDEITVVGSAAVLGFESGDGYSTGSLYGQNGWTQTVSVGGGATVQTTDVYSGSQAVSVTTPTSAAQYNYEEASLDMASTTNSTVTLRVNQSSTADTLTFFKTADSGGNVQAHVRLSSGNVQVRHSGTWNTLSGASYTPNTWHEWKFVMDYTNDEYDLYRDGTSVASNIPFYQVGNDLGELLIGSTTKTTGVASESLFDHISVSP